MTPSQAKLLESNKLTLQIQASKLLIDPGFKQMTNTKDVVEITVNKSSSVADLRNVIIEQLGIPEGAAFKMLKFYATGQVVTSYSPVGFMRIARHTQCLLAVLHIRRTCRGRLCLQDLRDYAKRRLFHATHTYIHTYTHA